MTTRDAPDLSTFPFFTSLSPAEVERLQSCLVPRQYRAGQVILTHAAWRKMAGDYLAIITSGTISIEAGRDFLNIGHGGVLAQELLPDRYCRQYTIRAVNNVTLWLLDRKDRSTGVNQSLSPAAHTRQRLKSRSWWLLFMILVIGAFCWLSPDIFRGLSLELTQRLLQAGREETAIAFLQSILPWAPSEADLQEAAGRAYYAHGDLKNAIDHFRLAIRYDSSLAIAQNNLGVALLAQNLPKEAIPSLKEALELNPGSPGAYRNLGLALLMTNEFENASSAFQNAITLDPARAENHFYLGIALEALGRRPEAVKEYQLALPLSHDPELIDLIRARLK